MSSSDVRQKLSGELAYLCWFNTKVHKLTDMRSELACVGLIPKFTKLHGTGTKGEVARGAFYTKYFSLVRDESACRSID